MTRQFRSLQGTRARDTINPHRGDFPFLAPLCEGAGVRMVENMLIAVGDHRAAFIPPPPPHNMDCRHRKRVRSAHDATDIEIVVEIFDGDMERLPPLVDIGDDSLHSPIAVMVFYIAGIALQ